MKILFSGEATSGFGGMETVIRHVINTFSNAPFSATCKLFFFCRHNNMDKRWLDNIDTSYSFSNNLLSPLRREKHARALSRWIAQEKPDAVIAIDPLSCLLASVARKKANADFTLFSWPHFSLDHKKHAKYITCADYHLAISRGIRQQMITRGIAEKDIHLVFNPTEKTPSIIPAPEKGDIPTFLYVGRLKFEGQKRIKDLLEGLSRVPGRWKLHIIGDGSDRARCQAYSRELCIDKRITWHGWQAAPWKIVHDNIASVTALLLTSSFEGFPMTLLEAMARGIPCISADCTSGPADIIQPGVNGYLYPAGDTDALSALISALIRGDKTLDHAAIPLSITAFYSDAYFARLRDIIRTRCGEERFTPALAAKGKARRPALSTQPG